MSQACARHGGFYLGSIGGPAAVLAEHSIKKVEVVDYEDLGMEAIWKIQVEDFPAFVIINHEGRDFYTDVTRRQKRRVDFTEVVTDVSRLLDEHLDPMEVLHAGLVTFAPPL